MDAACAAAPKACCAPSAAMEIEAEALGASAVALATFQYARHHTPPVQHTYGTLGRRMAFVGVLGAGLPAFPTLGYAAATSPTATRCCRSGTWP